MKTGKLFLTALLDLDYKGKIYPVNPQADEIDGYKSYPSITAIPGTVDLAIILVPSRFTLPVVTECAEKKVKCAVLFTAGYKETGTAEGLALERALLRIAQASGMRLIGPNGMGIYHPKGRISFFPQLPGKPGNVALISHSGSLANILCRIGPERGVYFSKAVSLGNECDLSSDELLSFFINDSDTHLIAAYIEGIKHGDRFFNALRDLSIKKPVVIWKVGLTPEGAAAASSHTGALISSPDLWNGLCHQLGVISVAGFENWFDMIVGFNLLPRTTGNRIVIVSGPGGLAVSAAEAAGKKGIRLADLTGQTIARLAEFVPATGTNLKNPIDVGMTASMDIDIYIQAADAAAQDPMVDAIFMIGIGFNAEDNKRYAEAMIGTQKKYGKPVIIIKVPGFDPSLVKLMGGAGLPFFDSAERALDTFARVRRYYAWQNHYLLFP